MHTHSLSLSLSILSIDLSTLSVLRLEQTTSWEGLHHYTLHTILVQTVLAPLYCWHPCLPATPRHT